MKIARIITKTLFFLILILDIAIFGSLFYLTECVDSNFKVKKGDTLDINSPLPVTAVYNGTQLSSKHTDYATGQLNVDLKMFGIIPFSKATVNVLDELQVMVLGQPFGMKLYTKGVLVVDITEIDTEDGNKNPAKEIGIKTGDYVLSVDGEEITTNEDLVRIVENSNGKTLTIKILRGNKKLSFKIAPLKSKETGKYKLGIWVRDSSAGIGTLTFYSPVNGIICGLGHGVCDEDTGTLLKLSSGEIVSADIFAVEKGKEGTPGQLKGKLGTKTLGEICLNNAGGVYAHLKGEIPVSYVTEIALKSEVKNGEAKIYCTVSGSTPKAYDCKVQLKKGSINKATQNMIITITDEELLSVTGGIVQGLSGSPILQNGKLIGAVTHVLVDDPTRGYGIFAENMLESTKSAEKLIEAG